MVEENFQNLRTVKRHLIRIISIKTIIAMLESQIPDRSMEVWPPGLLVDYDRPIERLTNQPTNQPRVLCFDIQGVK